MIDCDWMLHEFSDGRFWASFKNEAIMIRRFTAFDGGVADDDPDGLTIEIDNETQKGQGCLIVDIPGPIANALQAWFAAQPRR